MSLNLCVISLLAITSIATLDSTHFIGVEIFKTWNDANQYCKDTYGTHLAIVNSQALEDEIYTNIISVVEKDFFIGLTDSIVEGSYLWVDNSDISGYSNWYGDEPNNFANEDCVELWPSRIRGWNDVSCSKTRRFICQRKLTDNPTQFPTTNPTQYPSNNPSNTPTNIPSNNPTEYPTTNPTYVPSNNPSVYPTLSPTEDRCNSRNNCVSQQFNCNYQCHNKMESVNRKYNDFQLTNLANCISCCIDTYKECISNKHSKNLRFSEMFDKFNKCLK